MIRLVLELEPQEWHALRALAQSGMDDARPVVADVARTFLRALENVSTAPEKPRRSPSSGRGARRVAVAGATAPVVDDVATPPDAARGRGRRIEPSPTPGARVPISKAGFLSATLRRYPNARLHNLLSLAEMRRTLRWPKPAFDRIVLQLAHEGALTLHYHDHPSGLSPAERAELVADAQGTHYIGMVWEAGADRYVDAPQRRPSSTNVEGSFASLFSMLARRHGSRVPLDELLSRRPLSLDEEQLLAHLGDELERGRYTLDDDGHVSRVEQARAPKARPTSEFATAVLAAALDGPEGWHDDERVFIAHVWRRMQRYQPIGLDDFKRRLVAEQREDTLTLGRAELPHVMDPADLDASRVRDRLVDYVFVKVPPELRHSGDALRARQPENISTRRPRR